MSAQDRVRVALTVAGLLAFVGLGTAWIQSGGWRAPRLQIEWLRADLHRKIYPEQDPEHAIYDDTAKGPISLGQLIAQFRVAWSREKVATVHAAACEIATGLLHHDDIEVGDLDHGKFVPWSLPPWEAEAKIAGELMPARDFFSDDTRFVFRRKTPGP